MQLSHTLICVCRREIPVSQGLLDSDPLLASIVSKLSNKQLLSSSGEFGAASTLRASSRSSRHNIKGMELAMKMWTCSFQDLELQLQIGQGSFGKVGGNLPSLFPL